MNRRLPTAVLTLLLTVGVASAQDSRLPDMGSSAGTVLSPVQQDQYGAMTLSQLRNAGYVLDDPLLDDWLDDVGQRLASVSAKPQQHFTFFMLKVREINAFATLGGYVGVNAGLVLAAKSEDEVAGVLAHEISHVTQNHVLRGAEKAQRESIPILLATLGAIIAAQKSGSTNSGDAASAAVMTGLGVLQQRQISYTRDNEAEADRIGIRTMARAGYNPEAMADFFQTLQAWVQMNQGDLRAQVPDYLQTHPLTLTRISEARERADKLEAQPRAFTSFTPSSNPLLPPDLRVLPARMTPAAKPGGARFGFARERLRALSASTAAQAIREYQQMQKPGKPLDDGERYGLAVAYQQAGQYAQALQELQPLLQTQPDNLWVQVTAGEAESASGRIAESDRRFEALLSRMPTRAAIALSYARALAARNTPAAGTRAVAVLRPLLADHADSPLLQQIYARANEIAGDPVRAGEAWAEAAYLDGRPEQALVQLNNLKKRPDLDYYARSRIDARIAAITPVVLELRRQGVRDEDVDSGRLGFGIGTSR